MARTKLPDKWEGFTKCMLESQARPKVYSVVETDEKPLAGMAATGEHGARGTRLRGEATVRDDASVC